MFKSSFNVQNERMYINPTFVVANKYFTFLPTSNSKIFGWVNVFTFESLTVSAMNDCKCSPLDN